MAALAAAVAIAAYAWDDLVGGAPRRLIQSAFARLYTVKNALWVVMGLNGLAYAGLTLATIFPRLLSLPPEVQRDVPHAAQLMFRMVIVLKMVLMLFGAYLIWSLVEIGMGRPGGVTLRFVILFLLAIPAPLIYYTVKLRKYTR